MVVLVNNMETIGHLCGKTREIVYYCLLIFYFRTKTKLKTVFKDKEEVVLLEQ